MSNLTKGAPSNIFDEDIPRKDYANSKNKLYEFNMDYELMPKKNEVFWKTHGKYDATCKNCGTRRYFGGNTKTALQCPKCGAGYNPQTGMRAEYKKNKLVDLEDNKWSADVIAKGKHLRDLESEQDSEEEEKPKKSKKKQEESEEEDSGELSMREASRKRKEANSKASDSVEDFFNKLDTDSEPPAKKAAKKPAAEAKKPAEPKKPAATPKKAATVKTTKSSEDNLEIIELDKNISAAELMSLIKSNSDGSSRIIIVNQGDILSLGDKLYIVQ